jgi:hypothetical protein
MSTIFTTAAALACFVIPQVGVVRDVAPDSSMSEYRGAVKVPCDLTDNAAFDYWRAEIRRQQDQECPRCFPNSKPWSH